MSLVRTSLRNAHGPTGTASRGRKAHRVPGRCRADTSRKIPVRPPQRCRVAVRATSTVGLASGPPGGRRAASTLDRATRTVCHMGQGPRQSSRREYPGRDAGQTACAGPGTPLPGEALRFHFPHPMTRWFAISDRTPFCRPSRPGAGLTAARPMTPSSPPASRCGPPPGFETRTDPARRRCSDHRCPAAGTQRARPDPCLCCRRRTAR